MGIYQDIDDYLATIQISNVKHLLVEGVSDARLFERLFHFYKQDDIEIDVADDLDVFSEFGNRGKVELVCEAVQDDVYIVNKRFAGFVDREFREFEYKEAIVDRLSCHNVIGCLVWSRGHSAENYFFEYSILSELFRDLLNIESKLLSDSLYKFNQVLEQTIRTACAIGLAAYGCNRIQKIRETINWKILTDEAGMITINVESWRLSLIKKLKNFDKENSETIAEDIISGYRFYLLRLEKTDIRIVRWLCDGHIGFDLILSAYCYCLSGILVDQQDVKIQPLIDTILGIKSNRFLHCINWWARQVISNQCSYPLELFQLLQIHPNFNL